MFAADPINRIANALGSISALIAAGLVLEGVFTALMLALAGWGVNRMRGRDFAAPPPGRQA
jgi:hypothetical protein